MISVIVPVYNEQDNILPLLEEISKAAQRIPVTEIVYIDDGSSDKTNSLLRSLRAEFPLLRALKHSARSGQSVALSTGVRAAANEIVVTLDGDGQNDPADIEKLYAIFEGAGGASAKIMVAGQRQKREDNLIRRISSRLANKIRSALLKDKTRDTGCSLKMFRRSDFLNLPFFNHIHRYMPAMMMREGVEVRHVDVSHRPRTRGASKYGTLDRLLVSFSDLIGVMWLIRRARPSALFVEEV